MPRRASSQIVYPSEVRRYADPATELEVFRLTDPAQASFLPASYGRALSHRGNYLIYSAEESGPVRGCRMDLKTGASEAIVMADGLMPSSLTLTPDERSVAYVAGGAVYLQNLANLKPRRVYEIPPGAIAGPGFSVSDDGIHALLIEQTGANSRLQLINIRNGAVRTLVEVASPLADPQPRPKRASALYRRSSELWTVNFDGGQNRRLHTVPGETGPAVWSPDGRQILYLNFPEQQRQPNLLRELTPESNDDRLIARTSQFVGFGRNGDASVIVGASASAASPYVLLLVRAVRRELALCEHRASDPRMVAPRFSPDSQRVFFQSDRDGAWAIFSINVEKLVSETEID